MSLHDTRNEETFESYSGNEREEVVEEVVKKKKKSVNTARFRQHVNPLSCKFYGSRVSSDGVDVGAGATR